MMVLLHALMKLVTKNLIYTGLQNMRGGGNAYLRCEETVFGQWGLRHIYSKTSKLENLIFRNSCLFKMNLERGWIKRIGPIHELF